MRLLNYVTHVKKKIRLGLTTSIRLIKIALNSVVRFLYLMVMPFLLLSSLFIVALRSDEIHRGFLRSYVGSSVYMVLSPNLPAGGTGFAIKTPKGKTYIITNDHVCLLGLKTNGVLAVRQGPLVALTKIVHRSNHTDLCAIAAPKGIPALDLSPDSPYAGQQVSAVGHPKLDDLTVSNKGEIISVFSQSFSDIISGYSPSISISDCDTSNKKFSIQEYKGHKYCVLTVPAIYSTSVLVKKGNSGSPLVNFQGDVVGVISGMDEYKWGMAVTHSELKNFLNELP